jgi:signal transduction histidine kinase/CheY-like chemotaxis protein
VFGKYLHANEGYNFYHEEADELIGIPSASEIERGLMTEEMYRTKKPHFIPDLLESPWSESRNAKAGYRAILAVPIIQDGVCYAHLRLASKKPGAFTKEHEDLLVLVASHMGPAIRNAELYQESEERGKRLAALNQFNQKIIKNLNLFEVLESTVGAAMVLLKAEHSRIFLLDETSETLALRATHGRIPGPPEEGLAFRMGEGVIGKLAKRGEAVILPDVQEEPGWVTAEWVREADVHSYIAAPLRQSGKVIGVINCFSREKNFFSEEDLDFLNTLATQATVAIQNARLFEEVQERTAELESARDEAEKVNTAKGEFIANLSHELRSPLNAMLGFSDLLLMLVKDEKIVDIAGKIRGAGKHLMRMIEDLLDLDRIETGKFRLDFQETAINGLVEEMVKSRREQLPENFTLKTKIDSKCGTVVCDPVRIIQILTNLLDNAVKYSPEGGTIWVRTQAAPGEVQITVEDEGLGMTPDEINVIFERFSQLESGMNRRAGGLGLGLSIVKKMLELHDGRILVKSTKGVGSAFSFVLPMIAVKHPSARKKPGGRTGSGSGKTRPEPWSGKNILVVDDLEHNHEYVKILMESARKIVSAYNGKEGIEAARRERPDLIFMDLRMPVLDGFEAIKRLKSDSETRDIPVLAVTAQAMDEDRERCLALGADGFITKPIDLEIFQKKIEEALSIQLAPGQ